MQFKLMLFNSQLYFSFLSCGGAGRLWANTEDVFAPLMTKVGSWDEHNKGLWAFTECPRLGTDDEGSIRPALRRSKASFWSRASESKDCCFMIILPLEFRQSYVMAWAVGTVFYAWMLWCFIEKGYVQVCFMLCSLRPYICKSWIIKFVSPLEAVPECPFRVLPSEPYIHQLLELAQIHVHRVSDAIQPSRPLSSPSPPSFNISQYQGLFQWVSSSHKVGKVLELQFQHQSFKWIFRTDFL